ncbi:MAG: C10 family peptidase [Paludibacteraceae bacterium]|nr:C10 family peptidase [Paludibacteraceae bacterium]
MKRLSLILLSLSFLLPLTAGERTVQQAAEITAQFINSHPRLGLRRSAPATPDALQLAYTAATANAEPAFYVFNQTDRQGIVFVSADDRMAPVLGYTESGSFDYATANPNLRWWLLRYANQIAKASVNQSIQAPQQVQSYTPIAPLLGQIAYDQEKPYNDLCPLDGSHRSLTGCVATAAAQVMRFWKYPAQGIGSHSYTSEGINKKVSADFNIPYDWDNMLEFYAGYYNTTQATAVATLMFHCGVASDMIYSYDEGSAAYTDDMAAALVKYFDYKVAKFVTQLSKRDYGEAHFTPAEYSLRTSQVLNYIYADLEQGRPVIMGGNDSYGEGGHEFVCDGRDSDGRLHINWGWSGDGNGYFAITALDYDGYEFSSDIDAILGLEPAQLEPVPVESITLNPSELTLKINEKQTISATILPADATVRIPVWTSSDPAIATVSNGVVKGISAGTVTITATAEDQQAESTVTVTSDVVSSQDFVLVTSEEDLYIGDEILIVNEENQVALASTQNQNNRAEAPVTITANTISIDEDDTDVQILTLTQGLYDGTFGLLTSDGYLYAASASKNWLRTQKQLTDDASWKITVTDEQALIQAQGSNTNNTISYNSQHNLFSAYKQQQKSVVLYSRSKPTALSLVQDDQPATRKQMRNGHLLILHGNQTFNAQGILIR